jgi:hypothetical protein
MTKTVTHLGAALAAAVIAVSAGAASASDCPPYPQATWWGTVTHDKVVDYVHARFDGDWTPYLEKWERRLDTAAIALERGVPIVFKQSGVELTGDGLAFYVTQLSERLAVSRCLAAQHGAAGAQVASNAVETAAD